MYKANALYSRFYKRQAHVVDASIYGRIQREKIPEKLALTILLFLLKPSLVWQHVSLVVITSIPPEQFLPLYLNSIMLSAEVS